MFQNKLFIISIVVCFIILGIVSFAFAAPRKGLVGHWSFDEGKGEVVNDASPEKNHGNLWGNAKWANEGIAKRGTQSSCVEFPLDSGVNIQAQGVESLEQITEAITIAAWLKIKGEPTDDQGNIAVKPGSYYFVYREGKLGTYLYGPSTDGGLGYQLGKTTLPLDKWIHVALTYDKKEIKLYLDGEVDYQEKATLPISVRTNEAFFSIGVEREKSRFFNGFIDEVMLYANMALTQQEIRTNLIKGILPVDWQDKLATTWGRIKAKR